MKECLTTTIRAMFEEKVRTDNFIEEMALTVP